LLNRIARRLSCCRFLIRFRPAVPEIFFIRLILFPFLVISGGLGLEPVLFLGLRVGTLCPPTSRFPWGYFFSFQVFSFLGVAPECAACFSSSRAPLFPGGRAVPVRVHGYQRRFEVVSSPTVFTKAVSVSPNFPSECCQLFERAVPFTRPYLFQILLRLSAPFSFGLK